MIQNLSLATQLIHGGTLRTNFGENSEALFLTQGHVYANSEEAEARFKGAPGYIYARFSNPTIEMFEKRMALLEGAESARATSTGMAAIASTLLSLTKSGDHIIAAKSLFGSSRYIIENILSRFGVDYTLVNGSDINSWQAAIKKNTKLFYFETPTNPTLEIYDITKISALAKSINAITIVDNVFATPIFQSPLKLGANIVIYSTTKHVDGGGRCLGGMILSSDKIINEFISPYLKHTGPSISPFNAWVHLKGLETLILRVNHQSKSAEKIANKLSTFTKISRVYYPFHKEHPQYKLAKKQMLSGSNMISFEIVGGKHEAFRFQNALNVIALSNNLGDAKSLITHPFTTTHERFSLEDKKEIGISENLLRLSVGLESTSDLILDIKRALDKT